MQIYLASQSPRRKEILSILPFNFKIHIPNFSEREYEEKIKSEGITDNIEITYMLAREKARSSYIEINDENSIIISADTIVLYNNKIYGKGINEENSIKILKELRNNVHEVITAVCILNNGNEFKIIDKTKVYFNNYNDELIKYYVKNYKPYDKAGAYGIQDFASVFVDKIEGSYHNVVGLPIKKVFEKINEILKKECSV